MRIVLDYVIEGAKSKSALFASVVLLWTAASTPAAAVDRFGYVGLSIMQPWQIEPQSDRGDVTYAIDLAYFANETWTGTLSFDFGLEGEGRVDTAIGGKWYPFLDHVFTPYVGASFIYVFASDHDIGWRASLGTEYNLRALSGIDNFCLYADVGASQLFRESVPNLLQIELIRFGLSWNY